MSMWPNWVDLVIVIIIWRGCYNGFGHGCLTELLNVIGAVLVTVATVNYAGTVIGLAQDRVALPPPVASALFFWSFFLIVWLAISVIRRRVADLIKWEHSHWAIQSIGLLLGGARGWWWSGFLLLALASSGVALLQAAAEERSLLGPRVLPAFEERLRQVADLFPGAAYRGEVLVPPMPFPQPSAANAARGRHPKRASDRNRPAR